MLTEDEARELLGRAAATIDVPPAQPVMVSAPRRGLVPAIAAAAVAAAVAAGFALIDRDHPAEPSPAPAITDQIPSVFAYDDRSATRLLEDVGLKVARQTTYSCTDAGRAERTEPAAGARFEPGDPITLFVIQAPPGAVCGSTDRFLAWRLLDYANGRGPSPKFTSDAYVALNGETVDLGAALEALAAVTRRHEQGAFLAVTSKGRPIKDCDRTPGNPSGGSPTAFAGSFSMSIVFPSNGPFDPVCNVTNVYVSADGAIEDIEVTVPTFITDPPAPTPQTDPDGIGARFLDFAKGRSDSVPVDTPVKLYLGGALRTTISAVEANTRSSYDLCPAYAERSCPVSAITTIADYSHDPVIVDTVGGCVENPNPLKPSDVGGSKVVILGVAEPATCMDDFAVQVFYNDVSQIVAVNLLLGSP